MASDLTEFMNIARRNYKTKTISVPLRNGKQVEIDIRELGQEQIHKLRSKSMRTYPAADTTGASVAALDEMEWAEKTAIAGITSPDLNNAELRRSNNAVSAEGLLHKLFDWNSIGIITAEIMNLSKDENGEVTISEGTSPELVKEAKNS